ncbi:uncharacterized protein LOC113795869 [Dermatophagoides pteronyssinus]|uniref:Uncharacterized protein n=1 Tax=Dermatophagoides pteronyssinus TaxID=6956 RepID=A0ABQ8IY41_DERPT|nr:hypothetical protein DERP_006326 [Dermatophagoides pteronyssinus]
MNRIIAIIFLITFTKFCMINADDNNDQNNCDKAIDSFVDECQSVRSTLLKETSKDEKIICCKHARYNLCMQALRQFVTSSQTINVCMDSRFDEKMQSIEPDDRIMSIEKQCKTFDTKTCITNVLNGAWDTINQRYNLTELSSSFSKNINDALESIGGFFKNIQNRISKTTS